METQALDIGLKLVGDTLAKSLCKHYTVHNGTFPAFAHSSAQSLYFPAWLKTIGRFQVLIFRGFLKTLHFLHFPSLLRQSLRQGSTAILAQRDLTERFLLFVEITLQYDSVRFQLADLLALFGCRQIHHGLRKLAPTHQSLVATLWFLPMESSFLHDFVQKLRQGPSSTCFCISITGCGCGYSRLGAPCDRNDS